MHFLLQRFHFNKNHNPITERSENSIVIPTRIEIISCFQTFEITENVFQNRAIVSLSMSHGSQQFKLAVISRHRSQRKFRKKFTKKQKAKRNKKRSRLMSFQTPRAEHNQYIDNGRALFSELLTPKGLNSTAETLF